MNIKTILLLATVLIIGCSGSDDDQSVDVLDVMPIKANEISQLVESFAGEKAVLVNVWATWCIPCVEEFPHIVDVQNEFAKDLQVIFISADFPEETDRINEFLKDQKVDWQTYIKDDRDEPFIDAVWTKWSGAIPATVVYNKNGSNFTFFERPATYEEFREWVSQAVNNN